MSEVAGVRRDAGRGHVVSPLQALTWLDTLLGYPGGFLELRLTHEDGELESIWPRAGAGELAHYVDLAEAQNADVEVSMLRPARRWGTTRRVPVLWVVLEGKKQATRLRRFRPVPTFVIRQGTSTRYTAFWALQAPLVSWEDVLRCNKRLAHALHAPKKYADPDGFYFAPPGSVLRQDRSRPCPVLVARCGLESYAALDVVGRLKDAPDPDAWREPAAA